jgi:hypothetical protein
MGAALAAIGRQVGGVGLDTRLHAGHPQYT